ncbi:SDR family oxidoreductase [Micromonospora lupini]|uniref:NmrA family protein n=1 Tax=Micromonospora lupini str. Lupac 08 TaxID=1150864 RepID=I0L4D5_9ACTN|nr:NAD(P)H-binding protein [Micromonospora lupini]CCH18682.1 NmrA family protein [Micromonospora lupini str. Lupac 08]
MDNLLTAAERAGVGHAVILSIVGVDQAPDLAYYRAKVLQEDLLKASKVPYSIVRATQFFEFVDAVISWTADENGVRLPRTPVQPMAAADVAQAVAESPWAPPCVASATSPAPRCSHSTNWAGSPSPRTATRAPSPPTTAPACSRPHPATC